MLRKPITYKDLDGNTLTEDFYFNLSMAELHELELTTPGGFTAHLEKVVESSDGKGIIDALKDIIRMSYGQRSEDGKRFIKDPKAFEEFTQTDAYSELFVQLVTDAEASAAFIRGLVPSDLAQKAMEAANARGLPSTQDVQQNNVQAPARRMPQDRLPKQRKDEYRTQTVPNPEVTEGSNTALPAEPVTQAADEPKTHYTVHELAALSSDEVRALQERGLDGDVASGYTVRPPHESGPGFAQSE